MKKNTLETFRQEIDEIDNQLFELLKKRIQVVRRVGRYKKLHNLPIVDKKREDQILDKKSQQAESFDLSKDFVRKIWKIFFKEAYRQEDI